MERRMGRRMERRPIRRQRSPERHPGRRLPRRLRCRMGRRPIRLLRCRMGRRLRCRPCTLSQRFNLRRQLPHALRPLGRRDGSPHPTPERTTIE